MSDFGFDWYPAAMKGSILKVNPQANILDVSHHIPPQQILPAGFMLQNYSDCFPEGTIHVCVIDPGVGSQRRGLVARLSNEQIYVCPDNGLLSFCLWSHRVIEAYYIENERWFSQRVSNTFHGRDIFAPVAAHLSLGVPLHSIGQSTREIVKLNIPRFTRNDNLIEGEVIYIDSFGNVVSNIQITEGERGRVEIRNCPLSSICRTYSEVPKGEIVALVGSSGFLEIAINCGNAAKLLQVSISNKVNVIIE